MLRIFDNGDSLYIEGDSEILEVASNATDDGKTSDRLKDRGINVYSVSSSNLYELADGFNKSIEIDRDNAALMYELAKNNYVSQRETRK